MTGLSRSVIMVLLAASAADAAARPAGDLQAMVSAAAPGAAVTVPEGAYPGPIVIDRPPTLVAAGEVVIQGPGEGDVIEITAPDVTVRGFTIRGTGTSLDRENAAVVVTAPRVTLEDNRVDDALFGFYLKEAPDSVIRRNSIRSKPLPEPRRGDAIRLWQNSGCVIEGNSVHGSRDVIVWFSEGVTLRGNRVTGGRYGMHFMYSSDATLEDNVPTDNSVGTFLMYSRDLTLRRNGHARNRGPSGFGVGFKYMDGLVAEDNVIVGNRVGLHLDNSPSAVDVTHDVRRNLVAYNDIGLGFLPNVTRNRFSENTFIDNVEQVAILGSGTLKGNDFADAVRGNFWSDYRGFDLDEDGIGDLDYRANAFFENLVDRQPRLRLFLFSPVQHAVEMAARAFPVVEPRTKITDPAPLMAMVRPRVDQPAPRGAPARGAAAILVVVGGRLGRTPPDHRGAGERSASPVIELTNVSKRFGRFVALDDVSLRVEAGEAVALWGPNGAGKSTLVRCLLGLLPFRGDARVGGLDVRRHGKAARRLMGYVPQEPAIFDDLRVAEVALLLRASSGPAPTRRAK